MDTIADRQFLISDVVGFYRYTAESSADAWATHVTNDNSFNNSLLTVDKAKLQQILKDWELKSIKATSLPNVWELVR